MNLTAVILASALVVGLLAWLGCGASNEPPAPGTAAQVRQSGELRRLAVTDESGSVEAKLTRDCLGGLYGGAESSVVAPPCGEVRQIQPVRSLSLEPGETVTITTGQEAGGVYVTLVRSIAGNDTFRDARPVGDSGQVWRVEVPEPKGIDPGPVLEIGVIPTATDSGNAASAVGIDN